MLGQYDNDADAIAMAPQVAREMMLSASFPKSIEADERREGLASYIDRIDAQGRNEVAEAIGFEGGRALFPKAAALIARLVQLEVDAVWGEADLRRLLTGFVLEARDMSPDVPPWSGPSGKGNR